MDTRRKERNQKERKYSEDSIRKDHKLLILGGDVGGMVPVQDV